MNFEIPPENQGEMIEVSYAITPYGVMKRSHDQSDRSESFMIARWTPELQAWATSLGPRNSRPPLAKWRQATKEEVDDIDREMSVEQEDL